MDIFHTRTPSDCPVFKAYVVLIDIFYTPTRNEKSKPSFILQLKKLNQEKSIELVSRTLVQVLPLGGRGEGEEEEQVKCICVNPGRLTKGEGGGTFVELNYYGNSDTINSSIIGI